MFTLEYQDLYDDVDLIEVELSKAELKDFFVNTFISEGKLNQSKDSEKAIEFMFDRFDWDMNFDLFAEYEDEMLEYFMYKAEEKYEKIKEWKDNEQDWFGTKTNVVGV